MILADSTVWIDHFKSDNPLILSLINDDMLAIHPFVVGELALGSLGRRTEVLADLDRLPAVLRATRAEVRMMIERDRLYGKGIGYVDAHLLASARITVNCQLWTRDKRLAALADQLGVAARLSE
jgi:predicted nucleic acid-binding protein